ncbi:uroporphyrinogen-III synthase [Hydrogenophaga sp.]|uniref:uroporphyrinogen-III synthase n=1 Tax=Hydrogenophaga sp. TaxID=1904254 RepID=UPI003F7086CE
MATTQRPTADARRMDRLIVTRPAPDAQTWVNALREQGWPAHALPLIRIDEPETPDGQESLRHWRAHWPQANAILFVSGAAVNHFFAQRVASPPADLKTRFWAPGPGTARLLTQALGPLGIDTGCIDSPLADAEQFDSEHLWPRVVSQVGPDRLVLIVRGASPGHDVLPDRSEVAGSGRDWLIQQCLALGARVEGCVAYVRHPPVLNQADAALIHSAVEPGSAWLFSSSEALRTLRALRPTSNWSLASALVTHPRIADAAREAGFGHVLVTRPAIGDVMRTLESVWYRP